MIIIYIEIVKNKYFVKFNTNELNNFYSDSDNLDVSRKEFGRRINQIYFKSLLVETMLQELRLI